MPLHLFICSSLYISLSLSLYLFIFTSLSLFSHLYLFISLCLHFFASTSPCLCVFVSSSVHVFMSPCLHLVASPSLCLFISLFLYLSISLSLYIFASLGLQLISQPVAGLAVWPRYSESTFGSVGGRNQHSRGARRVDLMLAFGCVIGSSGGGLVVARLSRPTPDFVCPRCSKSISGSEPRAVAETNMSHVL